MDREAGTRPVCDGFIAKIANQSAAIFHPCIHQILKSGLDRLLECHLAFFLNALSWNESVWQMARKVPAALEEDRGMGGVSLGLRDALFPKPLKEKYEL